jgi:hypothetical protein
MEPKGSLPHSQVPTTCPYPEPDQSSPWPYMPLSNLPLINSSKSGTCHYKQQLSERIGGRQNRGSRWLLRRELRVQWKHVYMGHGCVMQVKRHMDGNDHDYWS